MSTIVDLLLYIIVVFCTLFYIVVCLAVHLLYIFENIVYMGVDFLYIFVDYCILLSIIEYYCQLLKIIVSCSFFTCILLHILVHTCILLYFSVLLYIIASFCNIFLYIIVSCCVFMCFCKKVLASEGFMCFEASLPGLRKQPGGGGLGGGAQPPPFANTTLASLVWKGYLYALKHACPALRNSGGFEGAQTPPPICKHNARIMGLEGIHTSGRSLPGAKQTRNMYCVLSILYQIAENIYIYALLFRFYYIFMIQRYTLRYCGLFYSMPL